MMVLSLKRRLWSFLGGRLWSFFGGEDYGRDRAEGVVL